jgi:hypothetical protein
MDGALVNAGSHNPPSNVFYMLHKSLGGPALPKIRGLHEMEPSATLPLVTPSHDGLAMHEVLLLKFIFW